MVEVSRRIQVQLSPDDTWYGTYRFTGIDTLDLADRFLTHLRLMADKEDVIVGEKIALDSEDGGVTWAWRMTFKNMADLEVAQKFTNKLRKWVRTYRPKGQTAIV